MNSLIEFELENGTQILVEVPEGTARGFDQRRTRPTVSRGRQCRLSRRP